MMDSVNYKLVNSWNKCETFWKCFRNDSGDRQNMEMLKQSAWFSWSKTRKQQCSRWHNLHFDYSL